jgi:hypothetical protein
VNILQCNATNRELANSAACDYANAKLLQPDPTGEGATQLTIVEGPVGTAGVCDAQHSGCFVVINNASSSDPRDSVIVDISFAKQAKK